MIKTIYIYLYRYLGEPRYVGQTPNVEKRDRSHINGHKSSFDRFMAEVGRDKFTLEVIDQIEDIPWHGRKANAFEHLMMLEHDTLRPGKFGFNQTYPHGQMNAQIEAARVARIKEPDVRAKISAALSGVPCPQRGHAISEELRRIHSERMKRTGSPWNIGRKATEEHKLKLSLASKGVPKSKEHRAKIAATHQTLGTRPSKEAARKGGFISGPKWSHERWHIRRRIWNPSCKLCFEVL